MTATNHGLFGSVIAISLQKYPAVALALSPLSHFVLDAIPHFGLPEKDLRSRKFALILVSDAVTAVITTLLIAGLWPEIAFLVIACAFLAASPDLMWIYYQYSGVKFKNVHLLPKFHSWVQWSQHSSGLIAFTDIIWFLILFPSLIFIGIN